MIDYINTENFKYIYKQRILLNKQDVDTGKSLNRTFALNEVFIAERNVGSSSIYRLKADG